MSQRENFRGLRGRGRQQPRGSYRGLGPRGGGGGQRQLPPQLQQYGYEQNAQRGLSSHQQIYGAITPPFRQTQTLGQGNGPDPGPSRTTSSQTQPHGGYNPPYRLTQEQGNIPVPYSQAHRTRYPEIERESPTPPPMSLMAVQLPPTERNDGNQ